MTKKQAKYQVTTIIWMGIKENEPPKSEFIPPEKGKPYPHEHPLLVATTQGRVFITKYSSLGWANLRFGSEEVTHWAELPEPPEKL